MTADRFPSGGRNPKCKDCDLWKNATNVCVWGSGPKNAKIMVVTESVSPEEDRSNRMPLGKSATVLREELSRVGIDLSEVYITPAIKCRPTDKGVKGKHEKACKKYIESELEAVKPKYILTLGNAATKAVFKRAKITEIHGQPQSRGSAVGIPAFNPSYFLRDPSKLPMFRKDLKRFSDLVRGIKREEKIDWGLITRETLDEFLEQLTDSEWFSFDIETDSLFPHDPDKGKLTCISFCVDSTWKSWVLPLNMPGSPFPRHEMQRSILRMIAAVARKKKGTGWNAKFDNLWLDLKYGVRFPLTFDGMLAKHTLDENTPNGLKECAAFELDAPHYDLTTKEKQGNVDPMKLYLYGAKDVYYTLRLKDVYLPRLKKDPLLWRLFDRLIMRAARGFHKIEKNGLWVNLEKFRKAEADVRKELATVEAELHAMVAEVRKGKRGPHKKVNWNAPAQVAAVLFGEFGLEPVAFTEGGAPSTAEATLVEIKSQHPIADKLVRYRELQKFLGTYIEGWKEFMVGPHLYFSYKLHGTVTGRYSCRLHQTPRDGTIRNVIEAPPGWTFVQGDFSQAELRVAAIVAREPELIRCFKNGIDVHWRTLMEVIRAGGAGEYVQPVIDTAHKLMLERNKSAKRPTLPVAIEWLLKAGHEKCIEIWPGWKEGRKKAKGINFGFIYGMRENKFIEYAKLKYGFEPTEEEAAQLRSAYFSLYRALTPWHERQKKLAAVDGFVRNLAGRVRRLPGIHSKDRSLKSEAERQAINSPIQGFIGDFKAMALVELVEELDWDCARVVGEVHDSVLFWVRNDVLERELGNIERIMSNPSLVKEFGIKLPIPIEVELEVGPWGKGKTWSSKKK